MRSVLAVLLVLAVLIVPAARAAESAPVRSERATVTLVSDTDMAEAGRPLHLGLRFRLAPGWHTYWSNPGDAGTPVELHVEVPGGARAGLVLWPTPDRLLDAGVMSYGYTGEVVLPVEVTPGRGDLSVEVQAFWLVCAEQCVPESGTFRLTLSAGTASPSAEAPLVAASLARVPRPSPFSATVAPDGQLVLRGDGLSPRTVRDAWFLPSRAGQIVHAAAQPVSVGDGAVRIALKATAHGSASALDGVVVLRDRAGQDAFLAVSAAPGAAGDASTAAVPLPRALLLAFLGGVILNAMPCVFPVLAMKAVGLAGLSGAARRAVRASAVSYTAGVISTLLGIGAALLAARAAGDAAGWGFQFQSPAFVMALAWLLFLVGLNLSGVYEIGVGLTGAGQGLARRRGHLGSFLTGLLAVVVATPCTAPFMGAAIAAALAAPAGATLLIFAVMGLGLASPYALLALLPGTARILPRPGAWMVVLKQVLAFPMYAAVAWLLWVVSQQSGPAGVLGTAAGLVLTGFGAWAAGVGQRSTRQSGRYLGRGATAAAALGAVAVLASVEVAPGTAPASFTAQAEQDVAAFTQARLTALRAEGKPVFVDATAAWCVTCLVNERVALAPASVQAAFARYGVAYLKADWTKRDPDTTAFLRRFGRDGVPLYVVFPASRDGTPEVLPQILTEGIVLDAVKRAAS